MGFRTGVYAKVWEVREKSPTITEGRISISRKNKQTGEYEQDFNGWVRFVGTANAASALKLNKQDSIKLGDVDVTNRYDKEKEVTYTNFTVFGFEVDGEAPAKKPAPAPVDEGEPDTPDLPF